MDLRQHCGTSRRRQLVADAQIDMGGGALLNGIDFIEVLDRDAPSEELRQRLIDVTFIRPDGAVQPAGPLLARENFRISGGTRVTGIVVEEVAKGPGNRTLRLTVDRAGDFSIYELSLHAGAAAEEPPANMDAALSRVAFTFKADCPTSFDCKVPPAGMDAPEPEPALNYLAKDYESFRQLMLDRMATTIPAWVDRSPADLGVTLVEALAYAADLASYHQDAAATEAFLPLARLRTSVLRHARLLGYQATEGANARTVVALEAALDRASTDPPLIPTGARFVTAPPGLSERLPPSLPRDPEIMERAINAGALVFETMEPVTSLRVDRNEMRFHSWGDVECCLPKGSTVAHVVGTKAGLGLAKGDLVVLEERTPAGGTADDPPDPAHRQVVRLSEEPLDLRDHVLGVDVLQLTWGEEDALTFPLNLEGDGGMPGALARGNLVLVDHGRTLDFAEPLPEDAAVTAGMGLIDDDAPGARRRPRLDADRIVYAPPFDAGLARERAAVWALAPTEASVAQVALTGDGETWSAKPDLLASDRFAPDFKVEPLDDGGGRVLFGDGTLGRAPDPDADLKARIRVGGGPAGNIGPDSIRHIVTDDPDLLAAVRNPIPATGGLAAETVTAIKIAASRAFRQQKRAVTPADYVTAAETFPTVQRATAERRWTGSWHTVFLSIDRAGGRPVDEGFETDLRRHLGAQRLAGHDLEIVPPRYAPLDIVLIVCVRPDYYPGDVERDLLDVFSAGYTRSGVQGFFHPDKFSFGQPVRLSAIIAQAMQVQGVLWVGVRLDDGTRPGRFERMDQPGVDYSDAGEIPIGPKEVARLDNDPSAPEHGRLRFEMRGGR